MKCTVIGVRRIDREANNGYPARHGVNLYIAYKDANVVGEACKTEFLADNLAIPFASDLGPGDIIDLEYNMYGKPSGAVLIGE